MLSITKAKSKAIKWGKDKDLSVYICDTRNEHFVSKMYYQNWRSVSKVLRFLYCWNIYITDKWMPEVPQSGLPLELLVWFWSHPNGELKYETIMHTHTHTHMHTPVSSVWSKSRCGCCCFFFFFFLHKGTHTVSQTNTCQRCHNGKVSACQFRRPGRPRFNPWVGKIP